MNWSSVSGWVWIGLLVAALLGVAAWEIWQLTSGCADPALFCDPYLPNVPGKEGR